MAQCSSTAAASALGLPASVLGALVGGWALGTRPWSHLLSSFLPRCSPVAMAGWAIMESQRDSWTWSLQEELWLGFKNPVPAAHLHGLCGLEAKCILTSWPPQSRLWAFVLTSQPTGCQVTVLGEVVMDAKKGVEGELGELRRGAEGAEGLGLAGSRWAPGGHGRDQAPVSAHQPQGQASVRLWGTPVSACSGSLSDHIGCV